MTTNRDAESTAYRSGLDAAADRARDEIAAAEQALTRADTLSRPEVRKAEQDYQKQRLSAAKQSLSNVQKAIDAEQTEAEKAAAGDSAARQKAAERAAAKPAAKQTATTKAKA